MPSNSAMPLQPALKPVKDGSAGDDAPNYSASSDAEQEQATLALLDSLDAKSRHTLAKAICEDRARVQASDAVRKALSGPDKPTLAEIKERVGVDPSVVSRIVNGERQKGGPQLMTLERIALALGKRLVVDIE